MAYKVIATANMQKESCENECKCEGVSAKVRE